MKGYERVLELLDSLCGDKGLLYTHLRALLEAEAARAATLEDTYRQLLGALLRCAARDGGSDLRLLARLLDSSRDGEELAQLAPRLLELLEPAQSAGAVTPEPQLSRKSLHLLHLPGDSEAADAKLDFHRELDARSRKIGKLERKLDEDISETIQQNQQAGALLEGLLSRLQLAGEMPELIDEPALLAMEIEQLLGAYRAINRRLEDTRTSLQDIAADTACLHEELGRVRTLSLTDELTQLANRRAFLRDLHSEIARAERQGAPFGVAMIDLDYFKQVNDAHGHGVGDEVLRAYSDRVLSVLRRQDVVARYGGEEFVVLMPNTNLEGVAGALEKVRARLRKVRLSGACQDLPLPSFSAGGTEYRDGDSAESILQRADMALYQAKQKGRNRTELATGEQAEEEWQQKLQHPGRS